MSDYQMSRNKGKLDGTLYRLYDPYLYIAYLANYGFPGGWQFTADRVDVNVLTAQSLIYIDKGGVYEGKLGTGSSVYNCYDDYDKIKALSIYVRAQWSRISEYPLPALEDASSYPFVPTGLSRIHEYEPNSDDYMKARKVISDLYTPYYLATNICRAVWGNAKEMDNIDTYSNSSYNQECDKIQEWYNARVGSYCSVSRNDASIMIPNYQFPILWGSIIQNSGSQKKMTLWGTLKGYWDADFKNKQSRGHEENAEWVYSGFLGKENINGDNVNWGNAHSCDWFDLTDELLRRMTKANFSAYRVNAYDFNNSSYTINNSLPGTWIYTFDIDEPLVKYKKNK